MKGGVGRQDEVGVIGHGERAGGAVDLEGVAYVAADDGVSQALPIGAAGGDVAEQGAVGAALGDGKGLGGNGRGGVGDHITMSLWCRNRFRAGLELSVAWTVRVKVGFVETFSCGRLQHRDLAGGDIDAIKGIVGIAAGDGVVGYMGRPDWDRRLARCRPRCRRRY